MMTANSTNVAPRSRRDRKCPAPAGPASHIPPLSLGREEWIRRSRRRYVCFISSPVQLGWKGTVDLSTSGAGSADLWCRDAVGRSPLVQLRGQIGHDRLARARVGDEDAWRSIYEDLAGTVTGYLAGLGISDAEDLAGEVFLQVARDIHKFEGDESSFRSWVFVIAHRRAIDWRRAMSRRPATVDRPFPEMAGGDVEDEAMERVQTDRLLHLIDHLSDDQRQVIALRVIADLSLEETATVVRKSVGAVKALQHRALRTMRYKIERGQVSL